MILIDTGPLVALCDSRDGLHVTALKHLKQLAPEDFGTCDAVVAEACVHLPSLYQRRRLAAILDHLGVTPMALPDETHQWREVFDWLTKYADHEPDWADGCVAVLCGRDRNLKVWTYDREFRTTWRRPDGSAIPMAVRAR